MDDEVATVRGVADGRSVGQLAGRVTVGLWLLAISGTLGLAALRFRGGAAAGAYRLDLQTYFLPAARAVAAGRSPYEVEGYLYSPLPALLLAPVADAPGVLTIWTAINVGCCLIAVGAFSAAFAPQLTGWRMPIFVGFIGATLLWNWPLTVEFELGNTDTQVLAALAVAAWVARTRLRSWAGVLIVLAGLIKSWPLAIGWWLLRRSGAAWRRDRLPALLLAAAVGALSCAAFAAALGPRVLGQWVAALAGTGDYPWLTFSVWGVGRHLFATSRAFPPLLVSPTLATLGTVIGAGLVVALLVSILRRPGDGRLALWHVTCCVVLLLPISHLEYLLLGLPLLWIWAARFLMAPARRPAEVGLLVALIAWWYLTFRHVWPSDLAELHTATGYVVVLGSTVAVVTASVLLEARRDRRGVIGS